MWYTLWFIRPCSSYLSLKTTSKMIGDFQNELSCNDRPNNLGFLGLTYFREYPTVYFQLDAIGPLVLIQISCISVCIYRTH